VRGRQEEKLRKAGAEKTTTHDFVKKFSQEGAEKGVAVNRSR